jgi:ribosomal protein S18 acetylase RimI-like enzyme
MDVVVETMTTAFHLDPVWSWAFPDEERRPGQYRALWRLFVEGGLRYSWVRVTDGCEAATVWTPPGGSELSESQSERLEPMLTSQLGDHCPAVMELMDRFDAHHPHDEPHYHLGLLGTHRDHRGKGLGMALLRENLQRIDAEHMPAYLESTNPANLDRYRGVGFEVVGEFSAPDGGPSVTTMWRARR